MKIIDLTFTIENGMPTCGTHWHQNVELKPLGRIEDVGRNTHSILLGSHTGTHMDAPYHFVQNGDTIDLIDLSTACGEVKIVDFRNMKNKEITLEDVKNIQIQKRMLYIFGWCTQWKTGNYYQDFPYFSLNAIEYMVDNGMEFMAMDTPSPDTGNAISEKDDSINHKFLLNKKVIIVEYLTNTHLIDLNKRYEIYALPIKIKGTDGAPARVILKEIE